LFQKHKRKVKPFYSPPTLVAKQAMSALFLATSTGWTRLPSWLLKGRKTMPTAAGAIGMGCIGFPIHPVWEVTAACNLKCKQCHATAGKRDPEELTTEEGMRLLDQLAEIPEFRMLAFGGGEPLVRPDIFELVEYACGLGFEVSIATNGTLLTLEAAKRLKRIGVVNMAIGLNANDKTIHERITQVPGSFERTIQGIYNTLDVGMNLQINTTVMSENRSSMPALLDFASEVGTEIVLLYHLMPEGRGETDMELSLLEYQSTVQLIADKQRTSTAVIEPVCYPQYWAYLTAQNGKNGLRKALANTFFKGCVAGSGLCYVKPNGDVWPCPFVPLSGGNVRQTPLPEIWYESELFSSLRDRGNLKGKCGACTYREVCGGCRGRAYAHLGDYLESDPFCFLTHSHSTTTAVP